MKNINTETQEKESQEALQNTSYADKIEREENFQKSAQQMFCFVDQVNKKVRKGLVRIP